MAATGAAMARGQSKQDYRTPTVFLDAVRDFLRISKFSIDLAATDANKVAKRFIGPDEDSLTYTSWDAHVGDGWGWLNPPFDNIRPWAERCFTTLQHGGKVAFLVPASVGSNWYRDYVHGWACVMFINGRLAFMPDKPTWLYPKDCLLALYGTDPGYHCWTWR